MEPLHPREAAALRWSALSDRGRVRRNNEDAFLGLQFDAGHVHYLGKVGEASTIDADYVFAVSDGLGGAMAGEFASRIAVEKITRLLPPAYRRSEAGMEASFANVLEELFDQTHRALMFLGGSYEECAGMGATLSLCWFTSGWMYFAHVGDSRIYGRSRRDGVFRQITEDDTHVGWLYRQGKLNEREARSHPRRNVLQKALGAGHQFVTPQVGAEPYERGDRFLLCTDGVVEGLFDEQLANFMRQTEISAADLVAASIERSGRDNTTAIVVEAV